MTHNKATNDLEQRRHSDVNLRRALQQRYADVPKLPEGFAQRMQERMRQDTDAAPTPTPTTAQHRHLWPRVAAAAVILAVVGAGSVWWLRPETTQTGSELAEATTITEHTEPSGSEPSGSEPLEYDLTPLPSGEVSGVLAAAVAPIPTKVSTPHVTETTTSTLTTDPTAPVAEPPTHITVPEGSPEGSTATGTSDTNTETTTPEATVSEVSASGLLTPHRLRSLISQATEQSGRQTLNPDRPLAMALHAGTNGGGLTARDRGDKANIQETLFGHTKPANYYFASGNGYTYDFSTIDADDESPGAVPQKAPPTSLPSTSEKHRIPVSIGLSVHWKLTERLALETGLTYTRLASSFDRISASNRIHQEQRVHYLGIPVRLHVQLFRHNQWSGYGTGGGSIELPLTASLSTATTGSATHPEAVKSHVAAPVQFSVLAGVGVQYSLAPHIALYAEPSLQWFVPTSSDISTYRTEHQLTFIPAVGLRWEVRN